MCLQEPKFYHNSSILSPADLLSHNNSHISSNKFYNENNNNNHIFWFDPLHAQIKSGSSNNYSYNQFSHDISFTPQEIKNYHDQFSSKFYELIKNEEPQFEEFKQTHNNQDELISDKETNVSFEHQSPSYEKQEVQQNFDNNENLELICSHDYLLPTTIISSETYESAAEIKATFEPKIINLDDAGDADIPCRSRCAAGMQQGEKDLQDLLISRWKLPIQIADNFPPFFVSFRRYRRIMERKLKRDQEKKQKKQLSHVMSMNWHKLVGNNKDRTEALVEKIFTIRHKKQKYRYESRHKQASNRVRDNRGRFVKSSKEVDNISSSAIKDKFSKYSDQSSPSFQLSTQQTAYHTNQKLTESKNNMFIEAGAAQINFCTTMEHNILYNNNNQSSQDETNDANTSFNMTSLNNDSLIIGSKNNKSLINCWEYNFQNQSNKGNGGYLAQSGNNQHNEPNLINIIGATGQDDNNGQNSENNYSEDEFKFSRIFRLQSKQKEYYFDESDNQSFYGYNQQSQYGFEDKSQQFNQDHFMYQYGYRVKKKDPTQGQFEQQYQYQQSPILCSNFSEFFADDEMNQFLFQQQQQEFFQN